MMRHSYYVALFVGSAPMGITMDTAKPITTAGDVITLANEIRSKFMANAGTVKYPPFVILNLVPFGESPAQSPGPAATLRQGA